MSEPTEPNPKPLRFTDHFEHRIAAELRADRAEARVAALTLTCETLRQENSILKLSVPLEDELSARIDDMCKYLAMGDGFTLNGIARLLIETQRRIASDWCDVVSERREKNIAVARVTDLEWALRAVVHRVSDGHTVNNMRIVLFSVEEIERLSALLTRSQEPV